ncbi:hypothetical protein TVAG_337450 [Trichomonas vaginalis G3]|uniref:Chromo domain-containing protein n=1 Tax=Trichomonas vaginalis (strain ATCC PRA-98 / G3) TaxID=412133 RepID=A2EWJ1_TRIV3|nr:remodeling and spacing factor 1 family [Trichomonas vaginalis G3]EAY02945.1 hypothetical protein TVAG_337450 [Trichomonas vaginalis G3]KAI5492216.1 remodeling and spacing factor 1 family [Trichomonas vaginalis G3]|eukprot:XP_001315168.1 hypothetical protein [Trichomonas vaginalis G3]
MSSSEGSEIFIDPESDYSDRPNKRRNRATRKDKKSDSKSIDFLNEKKKRQRKPKSQSLEDKNNSKSSDNKKNGRKSKEDSNKKNNAGQDQQPKKRGRKPKQPKLNDADLDIEYYDYVPSDDFEYDYEYEYSAADEKQVEKNNKAAKNNIESEDQTVDEEEEEIVYEIDRIVGFYSGYQNPQHVRAKMHHKPYYIHYKEESYHSCVWMDEKEILQVENGKAALQAFKELQNKSRPIPSLCHPDLLIFDQDLDSAWYNIERIINDAPKDDGNDEYLAKWRGLTYNDASWGIKSVLCNNRALDKYDNRLKNSNKKTLPSRFIHPTMESFVKLESKKGLDGTIFTDEQLEVANFISEKYFNNKNVFIQTIDTITSTAAVAAGVESILTASNQRGPIVIVCQDSDSYIWLDAFTNFTNVDCTVYNSDKDSRDLIDETEFSTCDSNGREIPNSVQFDAMVVRMADIKKFSNQIGDVDFRYMVCDFPIGAKYTPTSLQRVVNTIKCVNYTLVCAHPYDNSISKYISDEDDIFVVKSEPKPLVTHALNYSVPISQQQHQTIQELIEQSMRDFSTIIPQFGIASDTQRNVMKTITNIRRALIHPFLVEMQRQKSVDEPRAIVNMSGKFTFVKKVIDDNPDKRILVFSQMPGAVELLEEGLNALGINNCKAVTALMKEDVFYEKMASQIILFNSKGGSRKIDVSLFDIIIIIDNDTYRFNVDDKIKVYRCIVAQTFDEYLSRPEFANLSFYDDSIFLGRIAPEPIDAALAEKLLRMSVFALLSSNQQTFTEFLKTNLSDFDVYEMKSVISTEIMDPQNFWQSLQMTISHESLDRTTEVIKESVNKLLKKGCDFSDILECQIARYCFDGVSKTHTHGGGAAREFIKKCTVNRFSEETVKRVLKEFEPEKICNSIILMEKVRMALFKLSEDSNLYKFDDNGANYNLLIDIFKKGCDDYREKVKEIVELCREIYPKKKAIFVPKDFMPLPFEEMKAQEPKKKSNKGKKVSSYVPEVKTTVSKKEKSSKKSKDKPKKEEKQTKISKEEKQKKENKPDSKQEKESEKEEKEIKEEKKVEEEKVEEEKEIKNEEVQEEKKVEEEKQSEKEEKETEKQEKEEPEKQEVEEEKETEKEQVKEEETHEEIAEEKEAESVPIPSDHEEEKQKEEIKEEVKEEETEKVEEKKEETEEENLVEKQEEQKEEKKEEKQKEEKIEEEKKEEQKQEDEVEEENLVEKKEEEKEEENLVEKKNENETKIDESVRSEETKESSASSDDDVINVDELEKGDGNNTSPPTTSEEDNEEKQSETEKEVSQEEKEKEITESEKEAKSEKETTEDEKQESAKESAKEEHEEEFDEEEFEDEDDEIDEYPETKEIIPRIISCLIEKGLPTDKSGEIDWEKFKSFCNIKDIKQETLQEKTLALIKNCYNAVTSENAEITDCDKETAKLVVTANLVFGEIQHFDQTRIVSPPKEAPEFWTAKHSLNYLRGIAKYGSTAIFSILTSPAFGFQSQLLQEEYKPFKDAAKLEKKRKPIKNVDFGRFEFLSTPLKRLEVAQQIILTSKTDSEVTLNNDFILISIGQPASGHNFVARHLFYNPGYLAKRLYDGTWYTCGIERMGDAPIFTVTCDGQTYYGTQPAQVCQQVIKGVKQSGIFIFGLVKREVSKLLMQQKAQDVA